MCSQFADVADDLETLGYVIVPEVLDAADVSRFVRLTDAARRDQTQHSVQNRSGTYGLRNLVEAVPEVAELASHVHIRQLVTSVLGRSAFLVRATLFDKTPGANWGVFWHQDLSIAVRERHAVDGFESWTRKAGVDCVQPPTSLMEQVLAVRLHLDDCRQSNGALKVLPGSHRSKKMNTAEVEQSQATEAEHVCEVAAGGILLMRPLLLHSSPPMDTPGSRRVIHLEFAAFELPDPLQWAYRIPIN